MAAMRSRPVKMAACGSFSRWAYQYTGIPTTKKIVGLDKPAGIAFDKDGKLYVTVLGTLDEKAKTKDGEQLSPGKLLVIDAGL